MNNNNRRITFYENGKTIFSIDEINQNGKIIKTTVYDYYDNEIEYIRNFDNDGNLIRNTVYWSDDEIKSYEKYDYEKNFIIGTHYREEQKTIIAIDEYYFNERIRKTTCFQKDGKTKKDVREYNINGTIKDYVRSLDCDDCDDCGFYSALIKRIEYSNDGKTIICIEEFDFQTNLIKETKYNLDTTINCVIEYNEDHRLSKLKQYNPDGTFNETNFEIQN